MTNFQFISNFSHHSQNSTKMPVKRKKTWILQSLCFVTQMRFAWKDPKDPNQKTLLFFYCKGTQSFAKAFDFWIQRKIEKNTYEQSPKDRFQNAIKILVDEPHCPGLCGSWYCGRLKGTMMFFSQNCSKIESSKR